MREGEWAAALQPFVSGTRASRNLQHYLVLLHVRLGNHEKAIDLLEPLMKVPYRLTPAWTGSTRTSTRCAATRDSKRLRAGSRGDAWPAALVGALLTILKVPESGLLTALYRSRHSQPLRERFRPETGPPSPTGRSRRLTTRRKSPRPRPRKSFCHNALYARNPARWIAGSLSTARPGWVRGKGKVAPQAVRQANWILRAGRRDSTRSLRVSRSR